MGIYNCSTTLVESLDSLLNQTFQDFDVIICDDGSTDNSYQIAEQYCVEYPGKFILLRNKINMGLNYSLNRCLADANGKYIARMDGDDISLSNRFETEVKYLENNPKIAIVSSSMIHFDEKGDWGISTRKSYPQLNDLVKGTPFAHAACMVRREAYLAVDGYSVDSKLLRVEDYHLWFKMYKNGYRGVNLFEPLYKMRDDSNAIGRRNMRARMNELYVKYIIINTFNLPKSNYINLLKPIILFCMPKSLYRVIRKKQMGKIYNT